MMTCAVFALLNMINNQEWHYIILPIGILIWGIFKFFDEDDRHYLEMNGIDPDEYNPFFPDLYDINTNNHHQYQNKSTLNDKTSSTAKWGHNTEADYGHSYNYEGYIRRQANGTRYQNPAYKGMVNKCKRNFKIRIEDKD